MDADECLMDERHAALHLHGCRCLAIWLGQDDIRAQEQRILMHALPPGCCTVAGPSQLGTACGALIGLAGVKTDCSPPVDPPVVDPSCDHCGKPFRALRQVE